MEKAKFHMQAKQEIKDIEREKWRVCITAVAETKDEQAFSQLFDDFAPRIKAFSLAAQPGATMVADELVQEVMIKVWNKAHLFDANKASVITWIYTLARNARIDYLRKNGRFSSEISSDDIYNDILDDSPDLFSITQQKQLEVKIRGSLNTLPFDQSLVLSKVYMEGKTHQQTAEELQLPLGTVKSRVRLALNKLEVLLRSDLK
jgi:RNA polymerase sigma-70 factor (ECF subfamily)